MPLKSVTSKREPQLRQVVEVADLEPHAVGRTRPVLGEELRLIDPVPAHVEAEAVSGADLLGPEQEAAAVAGAVHHAAALEPVRVDPQHAIDEPLAGAAEADLAEGLRVGARRRLEERTSAELRRDLDVEMPGAEPDQLVAQLGQRRRRAGIAHRASIARSRRAPPQRAEKRPRAVNMGSSGLQAPDLGR